MATAPRTRRKNQARKPARPAPARPRASGASDPERDDEPSRSSAAVAEIDDEALEFIEALDRFKRQHGRPFPSWSEVLFVLKGLGYRRP